MLTITDEDDNKVPAQQDQNVDLEAGTIQETPNQPIERRDQKSPIFSNGQQA